ncbi:SDR family oxidoreductase [Nodosilinea sp. P-1105]|uniref:SDR family oxidoreductase n=1 Tax=Nodosilinea sp. P-1105 TaxID=2546229 RepID=UPI00146B877E|nr:SDR family oxidoreductase [Nodosilinea sp. P-1105]NMF86730.1 NAD-dependent epimerase/dehydratase family protein [Nodosilinea sp. P-1105]
MQAFVTGSTGLLGSNLVRELVEQGYSVKALVRSLDKAKFLMGNLPRVQFIQGDLQNIADFSHQLQGCDVLFHTAAYFRESYGSGNHWPMLQRLNIDATLELLEAAETAKVFKTIYVSSSGCIGLNPDGSPGTETTPPGPIAYDNLYFKSKLMAEAAVIDFTQTHAMPVVMICPGAMLGPQDAAPTELGQFVLNFLHRKIPARPAGGMPCVDVRDVATAMVNAVTQGRSGQRYLIGGKYYSMADLMGHLETVSGVPAPKLKLPGFAMGILAVVSTWIGQLRGQKSEIPIEGVKIMLATLAYDSTKAQQELGIQFRPLDESLHDMVTWYRQANYL